MRLPARNHRRSLGPALVVWAALAGSGLFGRDDARAAAPPCRYTTSGGADAGASQLIVHDTVTGLNWQQTLPATPCPADGAGLCTWADAQTYCANLSYGGISTGWRVPTQNELLSIVDFSQYNPAIDTTYFPPPVNFFWSSALLQLDAGSGQAWAVNFTDGSTGYFPLSDVQQVRCVR